MVRNGSLDYARFVAAFGIVFFHAGAVGSNISYAALPFFLIVMIVLAIPSAARLSFADYTSGRARRLLLPWLLWSGVYGSLKLAEVVFTQTTFEEKFALHMIVTGPALHLWFLPFAFAICLLIQPFARRICNVTTLPNLLIVVLVSVVILSLRQDQALPVPFAQWIYGLPAVCLGIALIMAGRDWLRIGAVLGCFTGGACLLGATSGLEQLTIALVFYILCIKAPLPQTQTSRHFNTVALGIYLSHPLVLSVLERATSLSKGDAGFALWGCAGWLTVAYSLMWLTSVVAKPAKEQRLVPAQ
jgi:surface polysaccharide O-acyltransferase-like enzyme